ncbi:MAG: methyltransferase type 11 [Confluentimicrobium sp.]|uniref:methyltransferase domain-containing protein n=1 Tax=Actibacterium sp. TaxID=1872125 RepID=UPI000C521E5B|nr:methyltransferase domain-containing protein [Actibacterium sp.]MBC58153.1 methyltransferase type 11 [Actibacterium sp.]
MHRESRLYMQRMFQDHASKLEPGRVLDIGAMGRRPKYRKIWESGGWSYVGCDLAEGPNVDVVLSDPFLFPLEDQSFDAVISGQMLEHNEMFWLSFLEMSRVLKMDGLMIHIAPSRGYEHRAPQDCWRFYRDGMTALARWAGLEVVEATTDWETRHLDHWRENNSTKARAMEKTYRNVDTDWGDTIGVFRKTLATADAEGMRYVRHFAALHPQNSASQLAAE